MGPMGPTFLETGKKCGLSPDAALAGARCAALSVIVLRWERPARGKMEKMWRARSARRTEKTEVFKVIFRGDRDEKRKVLSPFGVLPKFHSGG